MELDITMLIATGSLLMGFITGYICCENSVITFEDLKRKYDIGYKFGYNDALNDIEHDLNTDLNKYTKQ